MAEGRVKSTELAAIAAAIRQKNGLSTTYKPSEMAAAIEAIPTGTTPTGTVNITQNGTTDVTQYASANVNVPNSYTAADEGKVVSNGVLVAQTARSSSITENGTYDTTTNNSITVNVSGGGGSGSLPAEYQRVEYIECDGGQYLIIPRALKAGDILVCVVSRSSVGKEQGFLGQYSEGFEIYFSSGNYLKQWISGSGGLTFGQLASYPAADSGSVFAGTIVRMCTQVLTPLNNYSQFKLGRYRDDAYLFDGRIYNFAFLAGGENTQSSINLIPCYRKADNVVGMYDTINGVFFTNAGTGSFTAGPDVT